MALPLEALPHSVLHLQNSINITHSAYSLLGASAMADNLYAYATIRKYNSLMLVSSSHDTLLSGR